LEQIELAAEWCLHKINYSMIRRDALASPNGNVRVGMPPGLSQGQLVGGAALHQPPPQT